MFYDCVRVSMRAFKGKLLVAMAESKLLPSIFAWRTGSNQTPAFSLVVGSLLVRPSQHLYEISRYTNLRYFLLGFSRLLYLPLRGQVRHHGPAFQSVHVVLLHGVLESVRGFHAHAVSF
jgi:hypothetical protein